jgi:hypothetical protein
LDFLCFTIDYLRMLPWKYNLSYGISVKTEIFFSLWCSFLFNVSILSNFFHFIKVKVEWLRLFLLLFLDLLLIMCLEVKVKFIDYLLRLFELRLVKRLLWIVWRCCSSISYLLVLLSWQLLLLLTFIWRTWCGTSRGSIWFL